MVLDHYDRFHLGDGMKDYILFSIGSAAVLALFYAWFVL